MVMRPFRYLEQYCFEGSASYSCVETLQRLCFSMWDGVLLLWLVAWPICSLNCLYLSFHQYLSYERDLKPAVLQSIVALTQGTSVCAHTHTHTRVHACTLAHTHTPQFMAQAVVCVPQCSSGVCVRCRHVAPPPASSAPNHPNHPLLLHLPPQLPTTPTTLCSSTCLLSSQPPQPPFAPPPASSAPNHPNHPLLLHLPPQLPTTPTTLCSSTCLLSSQPPQPPFAPPPQLPTTPTTICSSTFLLSSQPPQLPCKWRALR